LAASDSRLRGAGERDLFLKNEHSQANQSQKGKAAAAMKINRRVFLKQSSVGATGVLLGSRLGSLATEAASSVPRWTSAKRE
jgi:hypothetical protein